MNILEEFGKAFVFKSFRPKLKSYLQKAGIHIDPYKYIGLIFFLSVFLGLLVQYVFVNPLLQNLSAILIGVGTFISFTLVTLLFFCIFWIIAYLYLDVIIYQRIAQMEKILPEYLQVVSTNVKSGVSIDKALWHAIRPRFGILAFEMEIILKKVMAGHDLEDALQSFVDKYDSPTLKRAFGLLLGELDSGGKISHILDNVVTNLKNIQKMKAELAASVITYMIFIGTIVVVISPALFALSFHLLSFMDSMISRVALSGIDVGGITITGGNIDLDLFRFFSIAATVVVAFLSSLIISIIEKGDIRAGLKYIPIFVFGSLFCYLIFSILLEVVFGQITI